jgi:hypothetical protein
VSVYPWSWSERVVSHPGCRHGDAKSFLDALLRALETRGIEYELLQDYRFEYHIRERVVAVFIRFDQFEIPKEYEDRVLDYLHDIIYELGREVGFDPSSCPYLDELTDEWIFTVPGWWLGDNVVHYKYVGGRRIFL